MDFDFLQREYPQDLLILIASPVLRQENSQTELRSLLSIFSNTVGNLSCHLSHDGTPFMYLSVLLLLPRLGF